MKNINASYGFKNGDDVLKQLKQLIKKLLKNDVNNFLNKSLGIKTQSNISKHNSDVFVVTFHADFNEATISKIKDLLLKNIQIHQFNICQPNSNLNIYINATIGCTKSAHKDVIIYAEKALHIAKSSSQHFVYFDANLYKNESSNNDLVELIQYNIDNKKVEPYFQAISRNEDDVIVKYEALMRLFDQQGNLLSPGAFLEKAKSYRLYVQLMQILINRVFDIIIERKINISINLDYNDMINPLISDIFTTRLPEADIGKYLTIEILESERIQDFDKINEFIRSVKNYHVSIAIDDFGTGFSNYDYILKLDIDYLKIDGSLIQRIGEDINTSLIKSIVTFCKQQHIETVAEFVSDLKTYRYVKSLGIDYSQGFYIQKPLPIAQISQGDK
jgi:EAL domain-containing protein (putative c-di-GMP-specific phosphodiesterase class I)/GGDEF domain-containing protein